jgi:hypothetical protein
LRPGPDHVLDGAERSRPWSLPMRTSIMRGNDKVYRTSNSTSDPEIGISTWSSPR